MQNFVSNIKELAIEVIEKEASAVLKLKEFIDHTFIEVVEFIYHHADRVVVTGIGIM